MSEKLSSNTPLCESGVFHLLHSVREKWSAMRARYERVESNWHNEMPGNWPVEVTVTMDELRKLSALEQAPITSVPQGESLWLIETSVLASQSSDLTYPQRHFWSGHGWHFDALKAARYTSKEVAEQVADKEKMYPRSKYPVCGHMFQCGISVESETPRSEADRVEDHALMLELCHQLGAKDGENMHDMLFAAVADAIAHRQCASDKNWLRAQRDVAEEKLQAPPSATPRKGWAIRNTDGRWRTMDTIGMPDYTDDEAKALVCRLREHIERYAEDDLDDIRIVEVAW